jgi:hypothetical protein
MRNHSALAPAGDVALRVIRPAPAAASPGHELTLPEVLRYASPARGEHPETNAWRAANTRHILRGVRRQGAARAAARALGLPYMWSQLWLAKTTAAGQRFDLGLAGVRVVTTAGVGFLVDALQGSVEPELLRFHGLGEGTTAENSADTDLETELTTEYASDNTRATGTLAEGATANIFQTVATNTVDAAAAVTEHGILSDADVGQGVLLDRTVFAVVNLADGDSLESTYELTLTAGS